MKAAGWVDARPAGGPVALDRLLTGINIGTAEQRKRFAERAAQQINRHRAVRHAEGERPSDDRQMANARQQRIRDNAARLAADLRSEQADDSAALAEVSPDDVRQAIAVLETIQASASNAAAEFSESVGRPNGPLLLVESLAHVYRDTFDRIPSYSPNGLFAKVLGAINDHADESLPTNRSTLERVLKSARII